ncbi:nitrogenase cofactor biosynthesis protein NifB [Blastochloris viridis]|uniref:FeMo cofactor biosynthesis protein NifB n=1 Tax=Blastochloris viridis TaxID=1079 RepID=A0A0H5BCS3_BLAVI|nr:FeMo cofactor biosynthesis protein NifB [Blastochloris viridis]BAS00023.1 nitrogenase FeMo-cofactor synthesis FeS core scaffold and assembly protein NifB [Blastochloris viridis]CUU42721.1 molybdenum cofactor biosynthesis protein A [Blastochloris viridis]
MAFVPLNALTATTSVDEMRQQLSQGGCTSTSCGSDAGAGDLPPEIWARIKDHPCYSEEAHHFFARMHVAVAPACNIQCHYCNRKFDCANESRPGVVSERLTPEEALRKVVTVANEVPQLSVLGIAGPGDALFDWTRTKRTFEMVAAAIPDIKLCVSTNGLALPDHVEDLAAMSVDHVTITINMVDPAIGEKIYPWIYFNGRRHTGLEASRILHERQMLGLEMLTKRGVLVKVNSVLIPGINDEHLAVVNAEVTKRGAFLHNIMPLISDPAHGTHFGLTGQRGPSHAELEAVQEKCGGGAKLMRHCRQCRADAVGLLGEDRGQQFMLDRIPETVAYDASKREAYRDVVAREREDRAAAKKAADLEVAAAATQLTVAVATRGGGRVNQHFGHAREFQLYRVSPDGIGFVGVRRLDDVYCKGGDGEEKALDAAIAALAGVDVVLVAKIGDCPKRKLESAGLKVSDTYAHDYIETAISAYYAQAFGAAPRALSA